MKTDFYPELEPYSTGFLDVDGTHSLYWEQSGNPEGAPIVFVHGGPGGSSNPKHRRYFDPDHYRIILFDQRGAGKSQPLGCLENNTLPHLIADMEALRVHLHIEHWQILGKSWGSTLSLAYAQAHPQSCSGLILQGIYLYEQEEIDWFLHGMGKIFPEAYEKFATFIPQEERRDLLESYYKRLNSKNKKQALEAALQWSAYEGACASFLPEAQKADDINPEDLLTLARMEIHYFKNGFIKPQNSLLKSVNKIRHIPATIIQGRYDVLCPIETAYKLHKAWPEADYIVVPNAGHSSSDPGMRARLMEATENAKTIR